MCMFCASIPVAAAVGANARAKQIREQGGEKPSGKRQLPVTPITVLAVGLLVTASVLYHGQFNG
jgi:hypothetical protein